MNLPSERIVTVKRYEFVLDSPATSRDIYDAMFVAGKKLEDLEGLGAAEYDDALHIEARDEEVVVWFEREDD